jgi:protein-S-isoprenylcysteine O-methyltransferase Ste14
VYRIVRNPMYAGIVLVLLGEAIVFASWGLLLYALLLWGAFSLTVVGYEEPALREQFGDDYEAYSRAVPRWIPCRQRAQRRG